MSLSKTIDLNLGDLENNCTFPNTDADDDGCEDLLCYMTNTCPDDEDPEAAWRCTLFNVHHDNGASNSTSMGLDFAGYDRPPSMCSHSLGRSPEGELSYDPEDGDGDSCATFEPYVTTTISAVENPYFLNENLHLDLTCSEAGNSCAFECKWNQNDWAPCNADQFHSKSRLDEAGTYLFQARVMSDSSNFVNEAASYVWHVTEIPFLNLDIKILEAPIDRTHNKSAAFTFSFNQRVPEDMKLQCQLDGGRAQPYGYSQRYDNLGAKEHSFRVFTHYCPTENENDCIDKEATYTWTILGDNMPPDTLLDVSQDGNNITVHADCTDNRCDYQCSWISENGPWEDCNAVTEYKDMTCGTHQIWVRALDEAGNEDNEPATDTFQNHRTCFFNWFGFAATPPAETYETDAHFLIGTLGLSDEGYPFGMHFGWCC